MKLLLSAALAACLVVPAFGQETPACQYPYDAVAAEFAAAGSPVSEIPAEDLPKVIEQLESLTGKAYPNVTRGFIAVVGGKVLLGLESDGCLLPPIIVAQVKPERLSGREGNRVGA